MVKKQTEVKDDRAKFSRAITAIDLKLYKLLSMSCVSGMEKIKLMNARSFVQEIRKDFNKVSKFLSERK